MGRRLSSSALVLTTNHNGAAVSERAFGFDFSEVFAAVGDAHDFLFSEAEAAVDARGAKLGVKLASATDYCDLDVTAGDEFTQRMLREDKDIAADAAIGLSPVYRDD